MAINFIKANIKEIIEVGDESSSSSIDTDNMLYVNEDVVTSLGLSFNKIYEMSLKCDDKVLLFKIIKEEKKLSIRKKRKIK